MTSILRSPAWKARAALLVLVATVSSAASVQGARAGAQEERLAEHRAVWKIIDGNRKYQASAFAVGPRLVVTVAHNLFDVLEKAGTDRFTLVQAGREGRIEIARPRAISTTHDLALLETSTVMEHYLTVASALPHGLADQFHAAGYPKGRFETLSVIAQTLHGDVDYFNLPMERVVRGGMSGGPVVAPNGEVIAMMRTSNENVAGAVRLETLNRFLEGETGVACRTLALRACLDEAVQRTMQLAEGGDIAAQYQLGREHRYIPGAPEIRWLKRAAQGGHASARRELGLDLYEGARGLKRDWERSVHWTHLAAEEEDSHAQIDLSVAYLFGEGVAKDVDAALDWLHRALRNGDVGAEANLGRMYYEGVGLAMDTELGAYWLRRAAERGDEEARTLLEGGAN